MPVGTLGGTFHTEFAGAVARRVRIVCPRVDLGSLTCRGHRQRRSTPGVGHGDLVSDRLCHGA